VIQAKAIRGSQLPCKIKYKIFIFDTINDQSFKENFSFFSLENQKKFHQLQTYFEIGAYVSAKFPQIKKNYHMSQDYFD